MTEAFVSAIAVNLVSAEFVRYVILKCLTVCVEIFLVVFFMNQLDSPSNS